MANSTIRTLSKLAVVAFAFNFYGPVFTRDLIHIGWAFGGALLVGMVLDAVGNALEDGADGSKALIRSLILASCVTVFPLLVFAALFSSGMGLLVAIAWLLVWAPVLIPLLTLLLISLKRGRRAFGGPRDQLVNIVLGLVVMSLVYHLQHKNDAGYIGTASNNVENLSERWVPLAQPFDEPVDRLEAVLVKDNPKLAVWKGRSCQLLNAETFQQEALLAFPASGEGAKSPVKAGIWGFENGIWLAWFIEPISPAFSDGTIEDSSAPLNYALCLAGSDGTVLWERPLGVQIGPVAICQLQGKTAVAISVDHQTIQFIGRRGKLLKTLKMFGDLYIGGIGTLSRSSSGQGKLWVISEDGGKAGHLEGDSLRFVDRNTNCSDGRGLALVDGPQPYISCGQSPLTLYSLESKHFMQFQLFERMPMGKQDLVNFASVLVCQIWEGGPRYATLAGFADTDLNVSGGNSHPNATSIFHVYSAGENQIYARSLARSGGLISMGKRIITADGGARLLVLE